MSRNYTPTEWVDNRTVGTASVMNNMEKGIEDAHDRIDGVDSQIKNIEIRIDNIDGSGGSIGGEVDLSGYVTKETGNASQITFADGQTFQAKLDAGTLKGDKGDKGDKGEPGTSNIDDATASTTTTYSSSKIESTKQELSSQIKNIEINVKDFGAKGDGVTDDTDSINSCIEYAFTNKISNVKIPSGTFMIRAHTSQETHLIKNGGIRLLSNINLILSDDAFLKAIPTSNEGYNIISVYNQKNVNIKGGNIIGERDNHLGATGEYGYGIALSGSENIKIENVYISDCWGDGINIQRGDTVNVPCKKITIDNVICDNNRRQGMSIECVVDMNVYNSSFINTNGVAPGCGVDIEPFGGIKPVENVLFYNCIFSNNEQAGLMILNKSTKNIIVDNCILKENKSNEGQLVCRDNSYLYVRDCILEDGRATSSSHIYVENCKFTKSNISFYTSNYIYSRNNIVKAEIEDKNIIPVKFKNCTNIEINNDIAEGFTSENTFIANTRIISIENCDRVSIRNSKYGYGDWINMVDNTNVVIDNNHFYGINIQFSTSGSNIFITNSIFRCVGNSTQVFGIKKLINSSICNNFISNIKYDNETWIQNYENRLIRFNAKDIDESERDNTYNNISIINNAATFTLNLYFFQHMLESDFPNAFSIIKNI